MVILFAQRPLVRPSRDDILSRLRIPSAHPLNYSCRLKHTRIVREPLPILGSGGSPKANGITSYICQAQEYACLYVIAIVWLTINDLIGFRWEPIEPSMGRFLQRMWMCSVKC